MSQRGYLAHKLQLTFRLPCSAFGDRGGRCATCFFSNHFLRQNTQGSWPTEGIRWLCKRMCKTFPCILSLNTFCRLGDLLLLSFHFPWAPVITSTQALPGGLEFVWEAVSLGTSLALRRLGEVKRAQTVQENTHQLYEVLTDFAAWCSESCSACSCCQDKKSLLSYVVTWKQGQIFQQTKRVQVQNMQSE